MLLQDVIANVLKLTSTSVNDNTSPQTVSAWDSLRHIELVMAVEDAFAVSFPPAEVVTMTSVGAIRKLLEQRGIAA